VAAAKSKRGRAKKRASFGGAFQITPWWIAALSLLAFALIARLEAWVWLGAFFSELGFHGLLLSLLLALLSSWRKQWAALGTSIVAAFLFGAPLFPLLRGTRPTPEAGPTLRVMVSRLDEPSLSRADLRQQLLSRSIDAAALTAPTPQPLAALRGTLPGYQLVESLPEAAPALLVLKQSLVRRLPAPQRAPQPVAHLQVGTCQLAVRALNLPNMLAYGRRNDREHAIAELERQAPFVRSVWLGHLGSRADAADLVPVLATHSLRDGRLGQGRLATSPASLGPLGLPLDHVLVHGWLRVTRASVGAPLAAEAHRTLEASLELTESRCRGVAKERASH
jgi:hypothetical protein